MKEANRTVGASGRVSVVEESQSTRPRTAREGLAKEVGNGSNSSALTLTVASKELATSGRQTSALKFFYMKQHLWYVALFFSIYYLFYVLGLVLQAIAKHRVVFPETFLHAPH